MLAAYLEKSEIRTVPCQKDDRTMGAEPVDPFLAGFMRNTIVPFLVRPSRIWQTMDTFIVSMTDVFRSINNRLTRDLEPRLRLICALLILKLRKTFAEQVQLDIGELTNFLATRSRLCCCSVFIS
jgi:hypothetical protein